MGTDEFWMSGRILKEFFPVGCCFLCEGGGEGISCDDRVGNMRRMGEVQSLWKRKRLVIWKHRKGIREIEGSWFHILLCLLNPRNVPLLFSKCKGIQHWSLLPSPVTSTTGCCFHFGYVSLFFLELFLHSSPVAYWASTDLGSSSFSIIFFCLYILFTGFSRQEY